MKKHIPNLLTSLALFSGAIACVMAFEGAYRWVVAWVIAAAVFDFLDGFMARLLNAPSLIGKELDSLSDMVSFGMAPSVAVFRYLSDNLKINADYLSVITPYIPYFAFLLAIFSALRLAKFNIDERQTSSFMGLPTPANALFWVSFLYGVSNLSSENTVQVFVIIILLLIVVFSFLLISEIPMFSLKVKHYGWKGNESRYILIISVIAACIFAGISGIAAGIVLYIALSVVASLRRNKGRAN
ncbi:MAG: CDP-alcohol phosphatidyltransferase family protein [Prevotella sp.]|jgi:CDP-diacylglycerol--serine O-phosphatidyltransferase|nr:CDP-alcohol phosphatidyltransferase family protein [Prevotella sp.]